MKTIFILFTILLLSLHGQHSAYWNHKVLMYRILPNDPNEIIFLGDSITDRCEWAELFSNSNVKNRGLSGDKTSGILDRLNEVTESNPDKIFIMIGVNDLRHNIPIDSILINYTKIVENIISESPQTTLILQSVLPVNNKIGKPKTTNVQIKKLNSRIQTIAKQFQLTYADIHSHLVNTEQRLDPKYSEDGLHINGAGYLVWKSVIGEYINK